jgi:hypothetical protein
MTVKISILISGVFLIFSTLFSCTNTKKGTNNAQNKFEVLDAFQTPVIRGAGDSKGMRIVLKVVAPTHTILDSISYENITKPTNQLKTLNDTLWVDSYFYPNSDKVRGTESVNTQEFSSTRCKLYFHNQSGAQETEINNLKLKTDPTNWK